MINHSYKITIIILFYLAGCSSKTNEWIILFDGQKVEGMRGYKMSDFPWQGWEIKDETLKTIPGGKASDIITNKKFQDFELELEWKLESGGNSGIFYFATEKTNYIWETAPEMQVLDDLEHTDGKRSLTSAGSLYDLIVPDDVILKPLGEFNHVRIISKNKKISHWLNGSKVLEYEYGDEAFKKLVAKSKFKNMPHFAKSFIGSVGLQGDHGEVWYRDIRIREL